MELPNEALATCDRCDGKGRLKFKGFSDGVTIQCSKCHGLGLIDWVDLCKPPGTFVALEKIKQ